jgi:hypothetical protein
MATNAETNSTGNNEEPPEDCAPGERVASSSRPAPAFRSSPRGIPGGISSIAPDCSPKRERVMIGSLNGKLVVIGLRNL